MSMSEGREPIQFFDRGDAVVLRLSGVFGIASAGDLLRATRIAFATRKRIVLDLTETEHLSTAALQVLGSLGVSMQSRSERLALCGTSASVEQSLERAGVASLIDVTTRVGG